MYMYMYMYMYMCIPHMLSTDNIDQHLRSNWLHLALGPVCVLFALASTCSKNPTVVYVFLLYYVSMMFYRVQVTNVDDCVCVSVCVCFDDVLSSANSVDDCVCVFVWRKER
jgi:hypothetical protein